MGKCLENSEKLLPYEALLENIAHVVYRLDLVSGRFEYISGAASKLFGLDLDAIRDAGMDLVGRHMLPGDYEAGPGAHPGGCGRAPGPAHLAGRRLPSGWRRWSGQALS